MTDQDHNQQPVNEPVNDLVRSVRDRLWSTLPAMLPGSPAQHQKESPGIEYVERLPSMWAMYRAILLRRKPNLKRGQSIPFIAAETTLSIDPEWASRYRAVCGWPESSSDDALPLTAPQVFAAPLHTYLLIHPRFPISALGVVHAANEMVATRPIKPRESLRIRAWVGETRWKERGVEFDFHTSVFTGDHPDPVWCARTVIFRSVKAAERIDQPRQERPPESLLEGETEILKLSANLGRRYAPVAGDYNPIHLYPITARLFGFKRPIIHGMWTLAKVMGSSAQHGSNEGRSLSVGSLAVRFRRPLFLPGEARLITSCDDQGVVIQVLDQKEKVAVETAFKTSRDTESTSLGDVKV